MREALTMVVATVAQTGPPGGRGTASHGTPASGTASMHSRPRPLRLGARVEPLLLTYHDTSPTSIHGDPQQ